MPVRLAVHHPAYETLLGYATRGCPVNTGRNWTKEEIHAAIIRGPHESALIDKYIANFSTEANGKVASNWACLVFYNKINANIPTKIKVSLIAATLHNSKTFRSILYPSFLLKLNPHGRVPSVNKKSKKTSPGGAIDQIGYVLLRLIHDFAEAPECENIFQSK